MAGPPEVTLHKVPSALLTDDVEFKATIRGFPEDYRVKWMKDKRDIDITNPKYKGSKNNGDISVLSIKNVEEDDNAVYTIEVENTLGKGLSSEKLVVIGGIFFKYMKLKKYVTKC